MDNSHSVGCSRPASNDQFFISFFVGVLIDQPNDSCSLILVAALTLALEGKLTFSARIDLTFPTASDRHGLGTGNVDAGSIGIATYTVGNTAFDFNVGYY